MEEDLEGYMEWLAQAEDLEPNGFGGKESHSVGGVANSLKVDVGKAKGDPVVMGLLKSTMFPLQQVLEGRICGSPHLQCAELPPLSLEI